MTSGMTQKMSGFATQPYAHGTVRRIVAHPLICVIAKKAVVQETSAGFLHLNSLLMGT